MCRHVPISARRLAWTRDMNNDLAKHGLIKKQKEKFLINDSQPSSFLVTISRPETIKLRPTKKYI